MLRLILILALIMIPMILYLNVSNIEIDNVKNSNEITQRMRTRLGSMKHQKFFKRDGKFWGRLENHSTAELTLDPQVQEITDRHFSRSRSAMGAFVLVEVESGKVLGLSEYIDPDHPVTNRLKPNPNIHLALQSLAPGSGVFRLVSAAALLEHGVDPKKKYCYTKVKKTFLESQRHQFVDRLQDHHLVNHNPDTCNNLTEAISTTDNGYLAQVTHDQLTPDYLKKMSMNLGFDRRYSDLGFPYERSTAHIPSNPLDRAKSALGFKGSKINVLHAALLMSAIATNGSLRSPRLIKRIIGKDKHEISTQQLPLMAPGMSPSTAAILRQMMENAIHHGSARKVFKNRRQRGRDGELTVSHRHVFNNRPNRLRNMHMRVAGQASTRTYSKPEFIRYTWFVGYIPDDSPRWAVAVMVVNHQQWYVRALDIAHRVLREVLPKLSDPFEESTKLDP